MTTSPTEWNEVALQKLVRVLGEANGRRVMGEILSALSVSSLESPSDLHRFAQALSSKGGFAAAVGGLLTLHATMYGDGTLPSP